MPKWVYPLALAFLVFYIYNDANGAGIAGRSFVGFLGGVLDAVGDFVGAFSDADTPGVVDPQAPGTLVTTTPETVTLTTPAE